MKLSAVLFAAVVSAASVTGSLAQVQWPQFYSYGFQQPPPPILSTVEFGANFMQHKYNNNLTHIAAGFIYNSPSQGQIRLDAAYQGTMESSLFNFKNTTTAGLVENTLYTFTGSLKSPQCSTYMVPPAIILLTSDFLQSQQAVYSGPVQDDIWGEVATWNVLYGGAVPVTVFLNSNNTVVRYDFSAPGPLHTFTTTRFFNIAPGSIDSSTFENPC